MLRVEETMTLSLGSTVISVSAPEPTAVFPDNPRRLRVYVSFGTIAWLYFPAETRGFLRDVCHTLSGRDMDVVVSLGGKVPVPTLRSRSWGRNVHVTDWVDQWTVLGGADVFLTHHGINSTHEAIFHRVPMLSYPFFGDQPVQAARCQALGLALPLGDAPRASVKREVLLAALEKLNDDRDGFQQRMERARTWELRTMGKRDAVMDRVMALVGRP